MYSYFYSPTGKHYTFFSCLMLTFLLKSSSGRIFVSSAYVFFAHPMSLASFFACILIRFPKLLFSCLLYYFHCHLQVRNTGPSICLFVYRNEYYFVRIDNITAFKNLMEVYFYVLKM